MAQRFFDEDAADMGSILEIAASMDADDGDFYGRAGSAQARVASRRWQDAVRVYQTRPVVEPEPAGHLRVSRR